MRFRRRPRESFTTVPEQAIQTWGGEQPTVPHCDERVLHAPGVCTACDQYPTWQTLRLTWGIAFTGQQPDGDLMACPSDFRRGLGDAHGWPGNRPWEGPL